MTTTPVIYSKFLNSLSARDRRTIAIRFLRTQESVASLLLRCKGHDAKTAEARTTLACVLLMAKEDAPEDLVFTDPLLYKQLRGRITEIRMGGWLVMNEQQSA